MPYFSASEHHDTKLIKSGLGPLHQGNELNLNMVQSGR